MEFLAAASTLTLARGPFWTALLLLLPLVALAMVLFGGLHWRPGARSSRVSARRILDAVDQPVIVTDPKGRILYWNTAAEDLYGWSAEQVVGEKITSVTVPQGEAEASAPELLGALRRGKSWSGEFVVRRADGSTFPAWVSDAPILGKHGDIIGIVGVSWDLTEQKHKAEELRRGRDFSETLLRSSGDGILAFDRDWRYTLWNPAMEEISGLPAEEVLGRLMPEAFPFLEETGHMNLIAPVLEGEHIFVAEAPYVVPSTGRSGVFEGRYSPLRSSGGGVEGGIGIIRDITDRKRSEEALRASELKYRTVVSKAPVGIFQQTSEGRFALVNAALVELLGYESEGDLLETPAEDLYVRPEESSHFLEACNTRQRVEDFRALWRRSDGGEIWVRLDAHAVYGPDGQFLFYEGFASDVTRRSLAEEELRRSQRVQRALSRRLLEAQEGERKRISRDLHDEVGQIFTAIKAVLESAQRGNSQDSLLSDGVALVEEGIERVRSLAFDLRPAMLDDLGLSAALTSYARRQVQGFSVELVLEIAENLEISPEVETACFRVGQEAINNALRHAEAKRVVVGLGPRDDQLALWVWDNGHGFEVPDQITQDAESNLGLLGMKERAHLVGGRVTVVSEPGRGTLLTAHFPMKPGP